MLRWLSRYRAEFRLNQQSSRVRSAAITQHRAHWYSITAPEWLILVYLFVLLPAPVILHSIVVEETPNDFLYRATMFAIAHLPGEVAGVNSLRFTVAGATTGFVTGAMFALPGVITFVLLHGRAEIWSILRTRTRLGLSASESLRLKRCAFCKQDASGSAHPVCTECAKPVLIAPPRSTNESKATR